MRIISFCAMLLFPPKKHTKCIAGPMGCPCVFATLRTVGISDTLYRAYHSECMKKTGVASRFPLSVPAIYAMQQSSQPPDPRTYSAEVTSSSEQSPASSQTARPFHAPVYHTTAGTQSQFFFGKRTRRISDKIPVKNPCPLGDCDKRAPSPPPFPGFPPVFSPPLAISPPSMVQ